MQVPQPQNHRPAGSRPHHMVNSGTSMRNKDSNHPFIQPQPHPQQHQQQQRMSIPSPSPKTQYRDQSRSHRSSIASRPSPALSSASGETRANIHHSMPPRQTSATLGWDDKLRTPKEIWPETPREQCSSRVGVVDEVEVQFDHLLVRPFLSISIVALLTSRRTHYKSPTRSEKSSPKSRSKSNPPSSLQRSTQTRPSFPPSVFLSRQRKIRRSRRNEHRLQCCARRDRRPASTVPVRLQRSAGRTKSTATNSSSSPRPSPPPIRDTWPRPPCTGANRWIRLSPHPDVLDREAAPCR